MLYRSLGRTGVEVSAIGFGGSHFAKKALSEAQSIALVHAAIDRGITFMDNCWDYNDGQSEIRMGKALAQGRRRAKVFLETKIDGRTADAARKQIDESLRRLTDGPPRSADAPRGTPLRRSGPHLRRGWRAGSGRGGAEGREGSLHRLHRAQGPARSPLHARRGGEARGPLRRGADAEQRDGRSLPELRPARHAPAGQRGHRGDDDEAPRRGKRRSLEIEDRRGTGLSPLRAQPRLGRGGHRARQTRRSSTRPSP